MCGVFSGVGASREAAPASVLTGASSASSFIPAVIGAVLDVWPGAGGKHEGISW